MTRVARHSSEADIAALEQVCDRLANFGADVALEWVDGFLTAVLAGPRLMTPAEWLPALFGDAFERAFADPADVQQAMQPLLARWNVIASQLDVESMLDEPDALRLSPLMITYDDAARAELVAAGHMTAEEAPDLVQTGALWAEGFIDATEAFAGDWPEPDDDSEEGRWYADCMGRVLALMLPQSALAGHVALQYPGDTMARDQLIDEACFAVQDLRLLWLDHAPKPDTRRVDAKPGRNEPCPCGSGKKFKKCHGA